MKPLCHILSLFLLIAASSCEHKPLWLPESPIETTEIQYDWSRCSGRLLDGTQTPYAGALPPLVITEPVVITPDMM